MIRLGYSMGIAKGIATTLSVLILSSCGGSSTESNSANNKKDTGTVTVVSNPSSSIIAQVAKETEKVIYSSDYIITEPKTVAPNTDYTIVWTENPNALDYDIVIATDNECSIPVEYFVM